MSEFDNIPTELQERDQWLFWNASNDTPRAPLDSPVSEYGCSWSDPDTWLSFETVVEQARDVEQAGIGYVNAADNDDYARGLIGSIDIDGVVDEDGHPKDWLPSMQPFFDKQAYVEYSPSGTGLRIPVVGIDVPEWWSDSHFSAEEHEGVEVLTNKYSTYTGDQLRGSGDDAVEYGEWLDDWLREVYKVIQEEDPLSDDSVDTADNKYTSDDEWLTEEAVEEALEHVNPDCDYDTWKDIGMALVNCFGRARGGSLFKGWSRGGSKWDSEAQEQANRIINDASSYGYDAGTIVYYASNDGWDASQAAREYGNAGRADGGVAVPDTSQDSESTPSGSSSSTEIDTDDDDRWKTLRRLLREADNADDRAGPRFDAAMHLNSERHWANLEENEVLYCYDDNTGLYRPNGKQEVRRELTQGLEDQYRGQTLSVVMDHIRGRSTISQTEMGGPDGLIAAENCVIDLHEETSREHSPDYMFQSRLGTEFNPDADCPRWRAFLNDSVPSETQRQKLQEFVGYCLHHWDLPYHKALFLVGPTASGKSTFLDTVNALLGDGTVSSLTPQQLTTERFAPAELFGKWANIRNDIPKATVENTGMFKEVIAGDPMKAEKKNKDPFFFNPTAKHLFSANQLPEMDTDDEAFFRRILLVPFPETVPKDERDKHLDEKLQDELPGILNWAIEGLQRLLGRGSFTGDKSPGHTRETWSKWGDSVSRFAKHAIQEGNDDIPKAMVYAAYLQYCREESIPTDTQHMMTRQLKKEGFQDGRAYVDGSQQRVFTNISWTGRGEQLLDAAKSDSDDSDGGDATGLSSFD